MDGHSAGAVLPVQAWYGLVRELLPVSVPLLLGGQGQCPGVPWRRVSLPGAQGS